MRFLLNRCASSLVRNDNIKYLSYNTLNLKSETENLKSKISLSRFWAGLIDVRHSFSNLNHISTYNRRFRYLLKSKPLQLRFLLNRRASSIVRNDNIKYLSSNTLNLKSETENLKSLIVNRCSTFLYPLSLTLMRLIPIISHTHIHCNGNLQLHDIFHFVFNQFFDIFHFCFGGFKNQFIMHLQ